MRCLKTALAACAATALALACGAPDTGVTVKDIVENPARWVGKVATVRGEIGSVHGPGLFILDAPGVLDDEILVYTPEREQVTEGADVWVTGPVRMLVVSEIERELDLDLEPELEVEFESRPVMMSAEVTLARAGEA